MTENVRLFELQIKGANSVKELKEEISLLRDKLVQLDNTSEEYKNTVNDLIADEKKLKEVMSASKESLSNATGSYNSLVNEMGALKKVWREVTSEAERAKIGERISEINEELKRMDSTIGNNQRKVGSYEEAFKKALLTPQQELKKLRTELAQMEQGTAEYNATFKRMAELTHDVTEQQEMLKWSSSDLGDILGNLAGVAQGVAGGFSAVNAMSGLIAGGNEDVEKAMLTTQRWLQLIQGLGALEELGDRVKGLISGLKNFANTQNTVVASLGDFGDETKSVAVTTEASSSSLAKQSAIMRSATNATLELAEGMKLLKQEELKEIEDLKEIIIYTEDLIVQLRLQNLEIEEKIRLGKIDREEGENQIRIGKDIIATHEEELEKLKNKLKNIKSNADANKRLATSNTAVATTTKTATTTTTGFTGALGKAVTGVKTLGATIKSALISSGIGILIVALGTLLASMWKYIDGSAKAEKLTNKLKESQDKLNESLEKQEKSWEREEKLLQAQGASYQTIYERRKENLQLQLAEVRANLATQQAIAKDIGQRKLQKDKYSEFRDTLKELVEQEKALAMQLEDLEYDKYINEVQKVTDAEKKAKEERKKAWEERKKQIEEEKKKAKELYDTIMAYGRSELEELRKKYKEDIALLKKSGLDKEKLQKAINIRTAKYNTDVQNLQLKASKEIWDRIRANTQKQLGLYDNDTEEFYNAQIAEAERYRDSIVATFNSIKNGVKEDEAIGTLNYLEGLDVATMEELTTELGLSEKAIKDLKKALLDLQSTKAMDKLGKDADALANTFENKFNKFELNVELEASEGITGISPKRMKSILEERYNIQFEYLQKELELYLEVAKQKNLTDEDRAMVQARISAIQIEQTNLATQKTIESNYLIVDSYRNMADSMMGIASATSDILGSVSDMIMDNAEAQLKAGEITEEEYNRQFEKSKAIQIAQATINTIAGAVGAFMGITRDTGGWGIALAIAEATAVLASGMAQIQQIKNTRPNSSGSGANARYAEIMPNATSDYKPELTQNATGQQETENLANAISGMNLWVSVSDIDNAQSKGRVRVAESTF